MRIGELAHKTSLSTKAIRYYESIGVMPEPERLDNGYRDYTDADADRLLFVGDAQAAGLALEEIRHVLDLKGRGLATCGHVSAMVENRLEDIETRVAQLEATRMALAAVLKRAKALDPTDCNDPTRCQTIDVRHGEH